LCLKLEPRDRFHRCGGEKGNIDVALGMCLSASGRAEAIHGDQSRQRLAEERGDLRIGQHRLHRTPGAGLEQSAPGAGWRSNPGDGRAALLRGRVGGRERPAPQAQLDYVEFFDPETLAPVTKVARGMHVALAVFVGRTRLIDNGRL
jgi:hypothetical protein